MNHLHINVPNVSDAVNFFERYFGYSRAYPESNRVFLKDNSGFLLAIDPIGDDSPPSFPDWFHLGVCRGDPAWARELYVRMRIDGVKFAGEIEENEHSVVYFCWAPGPYKVEVRGNKGS